jgi:hypothetical protein
MSNKSSDAGEACCPEQAFRLNPWSGGALASPIQSPALGGKVQRWGRYPARIGELLLSRSHFHGWTQPSTGRRSNLLGQSQGGAGKGNGNRNSVGVNQQTCLSPWGMLGRTSQPLRRPRLGSSGRAPGELKHGTAPSSPRCTCEGPASHRGLRHQQTAQAQPRKPRGSTPPEWGGPTGASTAGQLDSQRHLACTVRYRRE